MKRMALPCVVLVFSAVAACCAFPASAQDKARSARPANSMGDWFPFSAYPASAKAAGEQGQVSVELSIDPKGNQTACRVVESSGHASLDEVTCALAMKNGRFVPAVDGNGVPVPGRFRVQGIAWRMDGPFNLASGPTNYASPLAYVDIGSDGRVQKCTAASSKADGQVCAGFQPGTQVSPPLVVNGKPSSGRMTLTLKRTFEARP